MGLGTIPRNSKEQEQLEHDRACLHTQTPQNINLTPFTPLEAKGLTS